MTQSAVALVEMVYDCLNSGDMDTLRNEVFAPDMVWRYPSRHPLGGDYIGVDQVLTFFEMIGRFFRSSVERIDTFGDDAVIEVHHYHGQTESGATVDGRNCIMHTIRDGRIVESQVFTSDQYGLDNFGWAAYRLAPIPARLGL
ncbi:MAG: nuclear transport factor 2 family protein [Egibacteraceae bacterium]